MVNLKDIPTCDLVRELETREGVDVSIIKPYEEYSIKLPQDKYIVTSSGPLIVLEIKD